MKRAVIEVERQWASIRKGKLRIMRNACSVADPDAYKKLAYRQGRWDGIVKLHNGTVFPAGLVRRVSRAFKKRGYKVSVRRRAIEFNPDDIHENYLNGIVLHEHQLRVPRTLLKYADGRVPSPTASGKTAMIALIAKYFWEEHGLRTLVVTKGAALVRKNSVEFKALTGYNVGQYGDGKKVDGPIVSATVESLADAVPRVIGGVERPANPKTVKMLKRVGVLIFDEVHNARNAMTWYNLGMRCPAKYRYGFSGTAMGADPVQELRLEAVSGPVRIAVEEQELVDKRLCKKSLTLFWRCPDAVEPACEKSDSHDWDEVYSHFIRDSKKHNRAVVRAVKYMLKRGRKVFVPTRRMLQLRLLESLLEREGIRYIAVSGKTPTAVREDALRKLKTGEVQVVLANRIMDEGVDTVWVDAIVLPEGVKSGYNFIQRLGRGKRLPKGAPRFVWVVDVVACGSEITMRHADKRAAICEAAGLSHREHVRNNTKFGFIKWEKQFK